MGGAHTDSGTELVKRVERALLFLSRPSAKFALIAFLYFASRWNHLHRELANEEGLFIIPGRLLFLGKGFQQYIGESVLGINNINPFHKPPLTSMLLGLFSMLSQDAVTGGRLLPLLVGFLICVLPLVLTGSMGVSFIVLLSPFFYAAASHMQTDPTVGLLGYSLILTFWYLLIWRDRIRSWMFYLGTSILWVGKVEILVIAMTASIFALLLSERNKWKSIFFVIFAANLVGVIAFVLITYLLGLTAGFDLHHSVFNVFQIILIIVGGLHAGMARNPGLLMDYFGNYKGDVLLKFLEILLAVNFLFLLWQRKRTEWLLFSRQSLVLVFFSVVPWIVYTSGGYAGDGFPRYLLIVFPPLFLLLAQFLSLLPARFAWLASAVVVFISFNLFYADFTRFWIQDGILTVPYGEIGCRDASQFALNISPKDEIILAPERDILLDLDRKWISPDGFEPYPEAHAAALIAIEKIRVFVLHKNYFLNLAGNAFRGEFYKRAKMSTKKVFKFGDYITYVSPELIVEAGGFPPLKK